MKIKRLRKVNKHLSFYVQNFGFRHPFQVLIDGTFCWNALKHKFNIDDQIPKYLQGEVKLLTTKCAILEMEKIGPSVHGGTIILKKFAVHKCGHSEPVTGKECFKSMVDSCNPNRYIIATQDRDLQSTLREIPAVPLLYLHKVSPVLEHPSDITVEYSERNIEGRFSISEKDKKVIETLKDVSGISDKSKTPMKRKKKKGGPNPLSCKKKKSKPTQNQQQSQNSLQNKKPNKKRRKRIKLPSHVISELINSK